MGQTLRGVPEAPALDPRKDAASFSIGAHLARERRLRGISLEELEVATRIPRRSLERLESGIYDRDQDAFARAFVRSVAAALGLDVRETISRMLDEVRPDERSRGAGLLRAKRLWLGLAVAGVVAGAALWFHARGDGLALPAFSWPGAGPRAIVVRRDPVRALAHEARVRADLASQKQAPPQDPEPEPTTASPAP